MSWTVHEDEYKTAGHKNLEQILQYVGSAEEGMIHKPGGRYGKNPQMYSTPAPLTAAELSSPQKPQRATNQVPWQQHMHTPTSAALPGMGLPYTPMHSPPQRRYSGRFNGSFSSGQYDRTPKSVGADSYTLSPSTATKRGAMQHRMDHPSTQMNLEPMSGTSMYESGQRDLSAPHDPLGSSGIYGDWQGSSKYQPPPTVTAESLRGQVYETAKDQHGCRFLQRWLDTKCDPDAVQVLMTEIVPHVAELMTDQYANFLVQKLFDIMPSDIRYQVAVVVAPQISTIALTPHGTFSVQKMIETISTREEMETVREALSRDVVRLVKDAHGNHVIQKVLQRFDYGDKDFIYRAVSADCATIAMNKQGCCVLQRCLEYASPMQRSSLVDNILACCLAIVQDPFGNYVLQYVLQAHDSKINDSIALSFLPHLVHLCMNKFSSNVMEKVLRGATRPVQEMYVEEMCKPDIVSCLIQDDFGNYVLQTALCISDPEHAERLAGAIRPYMPLIKNAPYAKKLEGKMDAIARRMDGAAQTYPMMSDYDGQGRPMSGGSPPRRYERVGGAYGSPHRVPDQTQQPLW